jgi:hypothetical protein
MTLPVGEIELMNTSGGSIFLYFSDVLPFVVSVITTPKNLFSAYDSTSVFLSAVTELLSLVVDYDYDNSFFVD